MITPPHSTTTVTANSCDERRPFVIDKQRKRFKKTYSVMNDSQDDLPSGQLSPSIGNRDSEKERQMSNTAANAILLRSNTLPSKFSSKFERELSSSPKTSLKCVNELNVAKKKDSKTLNNEEICLRAGTKPKCLLKRGSLESWRADRPGFTANEESVSPSKGVTISRSSGSSRPNSGCFFQATDNGSTNMVTGSSSRRSVSPSAHTLPSSSSHRPVVARRRWTSTYNARRCPNESIASSVSVQQQTRSSLVKNKSISMPSVILEKMRHVREKIHRHMINTVPNSSDWPPACALIKELHYSNCQFDTSPTFRTRHQQIASHNPRLQRRPFSIHGASSTCGINSGYYSGSSAKTQLSESGINHSEVSSVSAVSTREGMSTSKRNSEFSSPSDSGIICSEMDLKAIMADFKNSSSEVGEGLEVTSRWQLAKMLVTGGANSRLRGCSGKRTNSESKIYDSDLFNNTVTTMLHSSKKDITPMLISKNTFNSQPHQQQQQRSGSQMQRSTKGKFVRKQVSFDDRDTSVVTERKVSTIAEEVEGVIAESGGPQHFQMLPFFSSSRRNSDSPTATFFTEDLEHPLLESTSPLSPESSHSVQLDSDVVSTMEFNDTEAFRDVSPSNEISSTDVSLKSKPKEVEFDELGQTWEIYGAEPEAEILGKAIQHHLEYLMSRTVGQQSIKSKSPSKNKETSRQNSLSPNHTNSIFSSSQETQEIQSKPALSFWKRLLPRSKGE